MPYIFCIVIISPLSIFTKAMACFPMLDMPSFIRELCSFNVVQHSNLSLHDSYFMCFIFEILEGHKIILLCYLLKS